MKKGIKHWLTDPEWNKLIFQSKGQVNGILVDNYPLYGYKEQAPEVTELIMMVFEQAMMRVRGIDEPIDIEIAKRKRE